VGGVFGAQAPRHTIEARRSFRISKDISPDD